MSPGPMVLVPALKTAAEDMVAAAKVVNVCVQLHHLGPQPEAGARVAQEAEPRSCAMQAHAGRRHSTQKLQASCSSNSNQACNVVAACPAPAVQGVQLGRGTAALPPWLKLPWGHTPHAAPPKPGLQISVGAFGAGYGKGWPQVRAGAGTKQDCEKEN